MKYGEPALAFFFLVSISALASAAAAPDNNDICGQLYEQGYSYFDHDPTSTGGASIELCCVQLGGGDWQCGDFPNDLRPLSRDYLLQMITVSEPDFPDSFSIRVATDEGFVRTTTRTGLAKALASAKEYGSGSTLIMLSRDTKPRLVLLSMMQQIAGPAPEPPKQNVRAKASGEALVLSEGDWATLDTSLNFAGNETFRTGAGLIGLYFPDGSFVALNENTLASFSRMGGIISVSLTEGEVYCSSNGSLMSVRMFDRKPGLTVSSQDGKFSVRKIGGSSEISVYSGGADAYDDVREVTLPLSANDRTSVREGELPGIAEKLDTYRKWWLPVSDEKSGCCSLFIVILAITTAFGWLHEKN